MLLNAFVSRRNGCKNLQEGGVTGRVTYYIMSLDFCSHDLFGQNATIANQDMPTSMLIANSLADRSYTLKT